MDSIILDVSSISSFLPEDLAVSSSLSLIAVANFLWVQCVYVLCCFAFFLRFVGAKSIQIRTLD